MISNRSQYLCVTIPSTIKIDGNIMPNRPDGLHGQEGEDGKMILRGEDQAWVMEWYGRMGAVTGWQGYGAEPYYLHPAPATDYYRYAQTAMITGADQQGDYCWLRGIQYPAESVMDGDYTPKDRCPDWLLTRSHLTSLQVQWRPGKHLVADDVHKTIDDTARCWVVATRHWQYSQWCNSGLHYLSADTQGQLSSIGGSEYGIYTYRSSYTILSVDSDGRPNRYTTAKCTSTWDRQSGRYTWEPIPEGRQVMGITDIGQIVEPGAKAWVTLRIVWQQYTGVTDTWAYKSKPGYTTKTLICPATVQGRTITPDTNWLMTKTKEVLAEYEGRYCTTPREGGIYYLYAYVRCNWLLLEANQDVWYPTDIS